MNPKMRSARHSAKSKAATQKLLGNPLFRAEIQSLRTKWGIEDGNPKRKENLKKLAARSFKYNRTPGQPSHDDFDVVWEQDAPYTKDLVRVLRRFKLDVSYWLPFAWRYFKYNIDEPLERYAETIPIVRFGKSIDASKMPRIVVELGAATTLKDVKAVWKQVEELRKAMKWKRPKFKIWKNFERDSRIHALAENGETVAEICSIIIHEYGDDLDYGNIKKIVSTYRRKLGLPKNRKLITRRPE